MIAHGVNDIVSGGANLYFGATNQMNRMGSVNPLQEILYKPVFGEYADTAYMITSLGLGVGGGAASGMSKLATAAQLSGRASNEAKIVSRMKYFLADETGSVKLGGWGKGNAVKGTGEAVARQAKDIKVIGRLQDTAVAREWKGHDVLNIKNWTIQKNDEWVLSGIKNKQDFYTASPINKQNLWDDIAGRETVYGRELRMIEEAGYVKRGDTYFHPDNLNR
jgi:hypothetical protein